MSQSKADSSYLDDAMHALLLTWAITVDSPSGGCTGLSKAHISYQIRQRARKVLEEVYKALPSAFIGCCIRAWSSFSDDIPVLSADCMVAVLISIRNTLFSTASMPLLRALKG